MLAKYIDIKREKIDLDFLMDRIKSEKEKIEEIIKDIIEINFEDYFNFKWFSLEELNQRHLKSHLNLLRIKENLFFLEKFHCMFILLKLYFQRNMKQ